MSFSADGFGWRTPARSITLVGMRVSTTTDQRLCAEVEALGYSVSVRELRTLRELDVVETKGDKRGGRGRMASYVEGTAEVAAAVQQAKLDPTYRRKLCRAVLIAWVGGAPVGTPGLRWAFREHYKVEERTARNLAAGLRVDDDEPEVRLEPATYRVIARAQRGEHPGDELVGALEDGSRPVLGPVVEQVGESSPLPVPAQDQTVLGLAGRRSDGTWRTHEMGEQVWETLALAPLAQVARTAPRGELDMAKELVRPSMLAYGFEPSALVVADGAPRHCLFMRRWHGDNWWRKAEEVTP